MVAIAIVVDKIALRYVSTSSVYRGTCNFTGTGQNVAHV